MSQTIRALAFGSIIVWFLAWCILAFMSQGQPAPAFGVFSGTATKLMNAGTPVCAQSGDVFPAQAVDNSPNPNTQYPIGFLRFGVKKGGTPTVVFAGPLTLTNLEWAQVVAGAPANGLTPNVPYFLSASEGLITTTEPVGAGDYPIQVGIAISASTLVIQFKAPAEPI